MLIFSVTHSQTDSEHEHLLTEIFIITAGSPPGFIWTECVFPLLACLQSPHLRAIKVYLSET